MEERRAEEEEERTVAAREAAASYGEGGVMAGMAGWQDEVEEADLELELEVEVEMEKEREKESANEHTALPLLVTQGVRRAHQRGLLGDLEGREARAAGPGDGALHTALRRGVAHNAHGRAP